MGIEIAYWSVIAVLAALAIYAFVGWRRTKMDLSIYSATFVSVSRPRQIVAPNGKVVQSNSAFYELFGQVDKPIPDLLVAETRGDLEVREQIEMLDAKAKSGLEGYAEVRIPGRAEAGKGEDAGNGEVETQWRYVAAYPVKGWPGYVFWFVDDITLRRQMEQVINDQQNRFADLLENAPIGFYSVDGEGRFLFVNQMLAEWLGRTHAELESGTLRLHDILEDDGDFLPYSPFQDESVSKGEVTLKKRDGGKFVAFISQDVVPADERGGLCTRSVVRDLSSERAVARALERSEERFKSFFEKAPVGIALIDPKGCVTESNRAFRELLREPGNVHGLSLIELAVPDDRAAFQSALNDPQNTSRQTVLELGFHGGELVCTVYVTRMAGSGGETAGFIAHFIDTTEQKNLEEQFAQSQKMQAVGQLAGGIAHDFNNLLTAMIGFSDLLLLRHRPGDQSFADIMQIKQNANRAANLVRQLLAFSRQQTLQPRQLIITDILAELSHLLARLIGENIELKMIHGRDLGMVKADQGQLEQVVINLAVNARDAMVDGGALTIRTANVTVEEDKNYKGEVMPKGNYVAVEVEDTGCGIPREILDRIFDPFFSTKEVGAGTGLGLSTVYGIVKQTGGFIFVDSVVGRGTIFSLFLPHYVAGAETEAVASGGEAQVQKDLTGIGNVLLVEDEDAVRAFGSRALRNKGYTVLEANSGEQALEVLRDAAERIDLLITDVVMPRVDGPTLVKTVRESYPDLKVIFISGYTEDNFRQKLGEDERIHFLPKPFSLKQLAAKVKEVLGGELV
ncbi:hybrid sensor histidine kinase/response regulator [Denitrobaculum tricleocarpae]|uniref:histidine kinase n=1 Tax=Denitrobaculum tricleocarpae TaxID=2591009 RepID=A0A545T218_9PROT|nr:PAS domain-containing sensor histidine kinase [Denitrobaculum tricleocarpae]TQV71249.1 PAS domain S-box protein [Denitrobaculum tricleocarpae]